MKRLFLLAPLLAALALAQAGGPVTFDPLFWAKAKPDEVKAHFETLAGGDKDALGRIVNRTDRFGRTPLHYAAAFNENPEVTELLLEKGAELMATDVEGKTPLHVAAINQKNPEVIAVLLKAGADAKKQDIFGKTPLDYALENPYLKDGPAIALLKAAMR